MSNVPVENHTDVVPDVCSGDDDWEDLVHYNRRLLFVALGGPIILIYLYTSRIATTLPMPLQTCLGSGSGAGICNRFRWFLVWGICSTPEAIMFSVLVAVWGSEMPCLFESCSAIECPGYNKSAVVFLVALFGTWVMYYIIRMVVDCIGKHTYGLFKFDWDKYNRWVQDAVFKGMAKRVSERIGERAKLRAAAAWYETAVEAANYLPSTSTLPVSRTTTATATPMLIPTLIMKV